MNHCSGSASILDKIVEQIVKERIIKVMEGSGKWTVKAARITQKWDLMENVICLHCGTFRLITAKKRG